MQTKNLNQSYDHNSFDFIVNHEIDSLCKVIA